MSISILQLWLPIVLGTLLAWIASALIHMALKYHNSDYKELANEDDVMKAISDGSPSLGVHAMPFCVDLSKLKESAMQEKFNRGPVGFVTVMPSGMPQMGKPIIQQVLYFLVGCFLIAYCATLALAPGADYLSVFRFVAAVGFLTFGWGQIPFSIWYGHLWSTSFKYLVDALIYGLIVAGCFAWLWPAAA